MKRIFFMCLLLASTMSHAVQVSNLYSSVVQVPASLDDRQLLDRAFSEAIDDVLLRVSGAKNDLSSSVLSQAHRSATSWVAQHSIKDAVETVNGSSGPEAAKEVSVTFYKESVDRFLFDNSLPVWGENRPSILVWLIEEQNGTRQMFGANQPSTSLSQFFDGAKRYGLPVYAPLVDNVDRQTLSASGLWGFFEDDIMSASARYQTDVVLAVRMSEYGDQAVVEAMLLSPNQASRVESITRSSKREAVEEMLVRLSAILSDRYASVRLATPKNMNVSVDGVRNYTSMSTLREYLASIAVVRNVQLDRIVDGQVVFDLSLDGTEEKFKNSVALNSVLALKPMMASAPYENYTVSYEYKGKGNSNE